MFEVNRFLSTRVKWGKGRLMGLDHVASCRTGYTWILCRVRRNIDHVQAEKIS